MVELAGWRLVAAEHLDMYGVSSEDTAYIEKYAARVVDYERQIRDIDTRLQSDNRRYRGEIVSLLPNQKQRLREAKGYLVPKLTAICSERIASRLPGR